MALAARSIFTRSCILLMLFKASHCIPSDREIIQVISLTKQLKEVPPVVINVIAKLTDDPIILSPTDDLTPLTDVLIEASSVKVIVLGFTIGIKANVTKALINELVIEKNTVITIHVNVDNVVNLLQGVFDLAKSLVPVFNVLPVEKTSVIAAGAGAHLAAAVLGQLPRNVQVKQIIALDPVLPLLETDLFLKLLAGRSPEILIIHSSAGSYTPGVPIPTVILPGATVLYLDPNDLTAACGVGPSQYICRKGMAFKLLLDGLLDRLIVAPCPNIQLLNFFAPQKCLAQNATVLKLSKPPTPGVYYAVIAALAKENLIYGLEPTISQLLDCDLDAVLSKPLFFEYALVNLVRDLIILPISNPLGAGLAPLNLKPTCDLLPVVEVAGRRIGGFGESLEDLVQYAYDLLDGFLGTPASVVGDLGRLAGGVVYGLGIGALGLSPDGLYRGLGGVVLGGDGLVIANNTVAVDA